MSEGGKVNLPGQTNDQETNGIQVEPRQNDYSATSVGKPLHDTEEKEVEGPASNNHLMPNDGHDFMGPDEGLGHLGDDFDDGAATPRSENEKDELEALLEILTEAFNEVDLENSGVISTEQLGAVMDGLAEEGVIDDYTDEELEMLASDMDVDRNGYIPLEEFKDVLVRRNQGCDFTEIELKEAFSVLDVSDSGTVSAKELRAVMLACCDMEVRFIDGKKMIQAASGSAEKTTIDFEEFKNIIHWRPPAGFSFDHPHPDHHHPNHAEHTPAAGDAGHQNIIEPS